MSRGDPHKRYHREIPASDTLPSFDDDSEIKESFRAATRARDTGKIRRRQTGGAANRRKPLLGRDSDPRLTEQYRAELAGRSTNLHAIYWLKRQLSSLERRVFVLRTNDPNLNNTEIAMRLHTTRETVKQATRRIRAKAASLRE